MTKKSLTKNELIQAIAEAGGEALTRRQVRQVLETLETIGHKQLKKHGVFTIPGFAKFTVVPRRAQKARQGVNPQTKQPITIPGKPATRVIRAKPVKACKDVVR
jgi:DNA-binding protein HU-beta